MEQHEPGQVVPVRQLPAHATEELYADGTLVRGTDQEWHERGGVVPPARVPLNLGGAIQVERVLAQPEVLAVREALMAYGPAGEYRYDIGLTSGTNWGDQDVFHVIKVWHRPDPDGRLYSASGRMTGEPEPSAVAVTVRGILNSLERIKAIREDRDAYRVQTQFEHPDEPASRRRSRRTWGRPIKDHPQA